MGVFIFILHPSPALRPPLNPHLQSSDPSPLQPSNPTPPTLHPSLALRSLHSSSADLPHLCNSYPTPYYSVPEVCGPRLGLSPCSEQGSKCGRCWAGLQESKLRQHLGLEGVALPLARATGQTSGFQARKLGRGKAPCPNSSAWPNSYLEPAHGWCCSYCSRVAGSRPGRGFETPFGGDPEPHQ